MYVCVFRPCKTSPMNYQLSLRTVQETLGTPSVPHEWGQRATCHHSTLDHEPCQVDGTPAILFPFLFFLPRRTAPHARERG